MNTDIALFILRVFTGISLLYHGIPKLKNFKGTMVWLKGEGFPLPLLSTIGVSFTETFGGLFLILGIFVPYVATLVAFTMLVATFFHFKKGQGWKGAEPAATLFIIAVVLAIAGAGSWTLI